jgi:solute carrier family 34 (sodium-dependent phosphate cotransporter)
MSSSETLRQPRVSGTAIRVVVVLGLLFSFLLGVHGLGEGFKLLGKDMLQSFFNATSNPFAGLVVGILATTLVQSSSATTSMIVGLVAAPESPLPLANAIPMVMGANIGTTVTNTIVSLAHMGRPDEFRRAFAAATCHDFFNFIAVLVLLPVEMMTGYLQKSAHLLAGTFERSQGVTLGNPLKQALATGFSPFESLAHLLFESSLGQAIFLVAVSGILIFVSLLLLVKVLRVVVETRVEKVLSAALDASAIFSIGIGLVITVMVQSSSITTSLLVPLAGAGVVTLEQVFPVTLGANIGTTVTGFLASLAVSGPNAGAGVEIALVHFLFNVTGTGFVYPLKRIRAIPLGAARWLANAAVRSRKIALGYVFGMFYLVPAVLVLLDKLLASGGG